MHARIWGCRGSLAAPGPQTVRYGGNTPCVEVRLRDETLLVLDAGTGIRPLGVQLAPALPRRIHLLLTHLHLDHLQGLGFFPPLWNPEVEVHVWGPPSPVHSLEARIEKYLSPPLFPVRLSELSSRVAFHDVPEEPWRIGGARVTAEPVAHQGPTVGYRIEENGHALAYIPDHEPARDADLLSRRPEWISGFRLAHEADVLLHDSQYTEDEYPTRIGWGHSSVAQAVAFARVARAGRLVMFHHDPVHTDADLERHLDRARDLWGEAEGAPALAFEGMEIELPGR